MLGGTDGPTIRTNLNPLPKKRSTPPIKAIRPIDGLNVNLEKCKAYNNPFLKAPLLVGGSLLCFAIDNELAMPLTSAII